MGHKYLNLQLMLYKGWVNKYRFSERLNKSTFEALRGAQMFLNVTVLLLTNFLKEFSNKYSRP